MLNLTKKLLFIFEIANNHMGDIDHGIKIIKEFSKIAKKYTNIFDFGFKLQYRNLDTFIHKDYRNRTDFKYIKRFLETELKPNQLKLLKDTIKEENFISICTAFDEQSVDLVEEHGFDIIKIASCSMNDWPLLEKIAKTKLPIIISTAGNPIEEIDKVVSFFQHREKEIILMHCIGEYPTKLNNLNLNQIDYLKNRYTSIPIGFSTHEEPTNYDAIKIAIAKGAVAFERHIGLKTEKYSLNAYSSTPEEIEKWLEAANYALQMCGIKNKRYTPSEKESEDLKGLKRGVYALNDIKPGEKITYSNTYYAIPNFNNQILANDLSKYIDYIPTKEIKKDSPIFFNDVQIINNREIIIEIVKNIRNFLKESKIYLPNKLELEISHHYGLQNFYKTGAVIISIINREYCKKLILLFPGQQHPSHYHKKKEETFHILYGDLTVNLDNNKNIYKSGDLVIVERGIKHSFYSNNGCIFEEISTTHYKDDSFYDDPEIMNNKNRKTLLTFWSDWLTNEII